MPIDKFSSVNDGLEPSQRRREHFIAEIDTEDDRLWVPYAEGVWIQPCHFDVTKGGFSVVLKGLPGPPSALTITLALCAATRCEGTGDTSSMIGSPSPGRSYTNPQVKLTRW